MSQVWGCLAGSLARDAAEIVREEAGYHLNPPPLRRAPRSPDASLASGAAGIALLHTYVHRWRGDGPSRRAAERWIAHASESEGRRTPRLGFFHGSAGVGWAATHVARKLGRPARVPTEFERTIYRAQSAAALARGNLDLIGGVIGGGVAWLPSDGRAIVDGLAHSAIRDAAGIRWRSPASKARAGRELVDLGIAHGLAGVLAFLAWSHRAGVRRRKCRELMEGAARYLLTVDRAHGARGMPANHKPSARLSRPGPLRVGGWCYGDPGVGYALAVAARELGKPAWEEVALRIFLRGAGPPVFSARRDRSLCHGQAGMALLASRFYLLSGDTRVRAIAEHWFGRLVADWKTPSASARARTPALYRGFLLGLPGAALTLISGVVDLDPAWDSALLLSGPDGRN